MMFAEAEQAVQKMYEECPLQDSGLAVNAVLRDLHAMGNDEHLHPLLRLEAIEITFALAGGPDNDMSWARISDELKAEALRIVETHKHI